jgi:hypothetical protein
MHAAGGATAASPARPMPAFCAPSTAAAALLVEHHSGSGGTAPGKQTPVGRGRLRVHSGQIGGSTGNHVSYPGRMATCSSDASPLRPQWRRRAASELIGAKVARVGEQGLRDARGPAWEWENVGHPPPSNRLGHKKPRCPSFNVLALSGALFSCLRQAPLLISPSTQWRSRRQRTGHGGSGPLSRRSFRAPRLSVQNFRIFEKREVMFRHIVGSALESAGSLLSGWLGGDHGNGDSECKRYHRGLDRARAGRAAPCCRGSRFPRRCVTSRAPGPPFPPAAAPPPVGLMVPWYVWPSPL